MTISNTLISDLEDIQRKVCRFYHLSMEELTGKTRPNHIAHPRMLAMYLCRKLTNLSLVQIGMRFGNRDHGTVIHACKRVQETLEKEPKLEATIEQILAGEDPAQMKLKL